MLLQVLIFENKLNYGMVTMISKTILVVLIVELILKQIQGNKNNWKNIIYV